MRKKLLLALGGVFFAFMVGEIAARFMLPLLPDPPNTPFIGDDACMYRLRPSEPGELAEDHVDFINEMGFRDRNHPVAKPAGRYRVLGLGDSFVYGAVPPEENFLRVAERELQETAGLPVDIMLMGVPGWSTENQAAYLKDKGIHLNPDLVIVNFFVGNDVTGIPVRGRIIRGNMYPTTSPLPIRNLLRKSQLFVMFESLFLRGMMKKMREHAFPADQGHAPIADDEVSDIYLKIVDGNLPVFLREPDARMAALWEDAEKYLEQVDDTCQGAGVPWLLVLIPDEMQVDAEVRSQVLAGLATSPELYDFDAPQNRLKTWSAARGVHVLDLLPMLRDEHKQGPRLYVPNDTHLNKLGNKATGVLVWSEIERQLPPIH